MTTATDATSADQAALRRDRTIILAAIALLTALAWIYILHLGAAMTTSDSASGAGAGMASMPGMDMSRDVAAVVAPRFRPWGVGGFALVYLMWAVMMVGMMLPSVTPMVLIYAGAARRVAGRQALSAAGWFVAGYLFVWALFSLAATGGQWALTRLALLSPMMESASRVLGGALLIVAGLYQWSPNKRMCLEHCQTPLTFLMRHGGFRPGAAGSFRQGAHHGAYCVGCCALLMTLLFVGGVMNVLWIGALSILVLVEKIWTRASLPRVVGALLVAAGVVVLVRP